ncbi:DUF4870 domain-containing protein [Natrinema caseinilyticum]|uniref:DUF4870 domain-containing protein n=1 Tax=Natrinema caseinilyticum TaxID=2961570 RepID=UPI0020C43529|nr:DUF4870 domain-containing protein [Natrinema caseinilyticum]
MSNEHRSTSTDAQTQPGPDLLTERTLSGIFVHLLGLGTGVVLPAVVYLVAKRDFTRENARNAFNWQLLITGTFAVLFGTFATGLAFESWAPENTPLRQIGTVFLLVFAVGVFVCTSVVLINFAFGLIATGKAIFGSAWSYPLAPDFVGWLEAKTEGSVVWPTVLVGYAATVPIAFAYLIWTGIAGGPEGSLVFAIGFGLVVLLTVASIITPAVLVRDARANDTSDPNSRTNWLPYVGSPLVVAVLTYVLSATQFGSENPPGDAIYAFAGAVWLATVVYLVRQY